MAGYRRKTGKRVKPKYNKKNKKGYNKGYPIVRNMATGVPDRISVKLKYSDVLTLTTGVSGNAVYIFRGNSIFDPDLTSTGHQPLYHDNYAAIYERYVVKAAKIRIQAVNHSGVDSAVFMCAASTDQFATSDINAQSTLEQTDSVVTRILPVSTSNPGKLSMYMTTARALGMTPAELSADDTTQSAFGSNPSSVWYFNLGTYAMNATSGVTIRFQVMITYYVEIYGRLKQSTN